VVILLGNIS